MASQIGTHRNTVTAAYEELYTQGWIEIKANKGAFIATVLPQINLEHSTTQHYPSHTGFHFKTSVLLESVYESTSCEFIFTDGTPDIRLTQINDLSRLYSANMKRTSNRRKMNYYSQEGSQYFKQNLCTYLNTSRGLNISIDNMLITRSIEMSLFIISEIIIEPDHYVVVPNPGYFAANMVFHKNTKNILTIPVDEQGMKIDELERLCEKYPIRMVYTIPQNQYPTTSNLSAARRMQLLHLAQEYRFIIIEDNHDYDFHYENNPLLPLSTIDKSGMVIYLGSFGKSLAPGFRTGFIIAPENLIREMKKFLGIIDRQGDVLMEQALGELIEEGAIQRHLKRSIKIYKERRDLMASLLEKELEEWIQFQKPTGGLAFWITFKKSVNLMQLKRQSAHYGLFIPRTLLYQNIHFTAMRIGFGHLNENEMYQNISLLKKALLKLNKEETSTLKMN